LVPQQLGGHFMLVNQAREGVGRAVTGETLEPQLLGHFFVQGEQLGQQVR
jgi:hypothetical protein